MKRLVLILPLILVLLAFAPRSAFEFTVPDHFPQPTYNLGKSPLMQEKVDLGRALFYDPILSLDSSTSCASCHSPYNAFAHTDHDLSHGIGDSIGMRNAPSLFNLAWQSSFMWDGAVNHLDMQPLAPITDAREMGETLEHVVEKLQRSHLYPVMFKDAYGSSVVTGERILLSIAQFQLTLVSATAKYDSVQLGRADFSLQEADGYQLFQQHCNACHQEPLFSTYQFANNGLPVDTTLNDYGKWKNTQQPEDSLLFKIPSLRNISYSYPYMHDGRFGKLNEVLNHYTNGIISSPTLSPELKNGISLTANEKTDLIAFLLTLNDKAFVFNRDHQFPRNIFFTSEGLGQ